MRNAASVSIAQTREEAFMHDLQTFSNIEEENLPFALSMLGIGRETEKYSVFFGIRNVNEDYFTSPCTSLFTNSSCGIFPTLSAETPLANYPVASVGFDGKIRWNRWLFQLSVYNGTGYKQLTGKENVFRFCPKSDGILGMTSLNYEYNGSNYFMGFALRSGMLEHHENGNQRPETETAEKECARIIWAYAEQRLSSHCSLLLQYSLRTGTPTGCRRSRHRRTVRKDARGNRPQPGGLCQQKRMGSRTHLENSLPETGLSPAGSAPDPE